MSDTLTPDADAAELADRLAALDLNGWVVKQAMLVPNPDAGTEPKDLIARDRAFYAAFWRSDGAHWQHDIRAWVMGNTTLIEHDRYDASGALVDHSEVPPPPNMKGEGLDIAPSGPDYVFTGRFHEISSLPTRINLIAHMVRPNVYHPYPGNMEPEGAYVPRELIGGDGGPVPSPSPSPSEPIDYDRINSMIVGGLRGLISEFGGHPMGVRMGIQDKVEDGVTRLVDRALMADGDDPRPGAFQRHFSDTLYHCDGLYNRLKETVYEVLAENGLIRPQEPTK